LKFRIHILLLIVITFLSSDIHAQNKKEIKKKKEEMIAAMKVLIANGKLDSVIDYARSKANKADTTFQFYETTNNKGSVLKMMVVDGDTMYVYNMETFSVVDLQPYKNKAKDMQFRRLRYHVRKVYPYAKIAADKLKKYNAELLVVKSKRKRRKLMKLREKALKDEFEEVIKKMSKTSGRVLVKLIDRETGESTYDIIKEMRGGFKAFVYQGVGKLYGADLKQRYNPKTSKEDEMIERVVQSLIAEGEDIR
jgi:NADPH:quinone reductase-like Zn-dependent oxidoreductase